MSNKSQIAGQALTYIGQLYKIEREVKSLSAEERQKIRQTLSKPLSDAMHEWMQLQRQKITDGSAAGGPRSRSQLHDLYSKFGMQKGLASIFIAASPYILAERTGLEPATPGVTGRYSNQLNYHSW